MRKQSVDDIIQLLEMLDKACQTDNESCKGCAFDETDICCTFEPVAMTAARKKKLVRSLIELKLTKGKK